MPWQASHRDQLRFCWRFSLKKRARGEQELELDGNPCEQVEGYRHRVVVGLPGLLQLDAEIVSPSDRASAKRLVAFEERNQAARPDSGNSTERALAPTKEEDTGEAHFFTHSDISLPTEVRSRCTGATPRERACTQKSAASAEGSMSQMTGDWCRLAGGRIVQGGDGVRRLGGDGHARRRPATSHVNTRAYQASLRRMSGEGQVGSDDAQEHPSASSDGEGTTLVSGTRVSARPSSAGLALALAGRSLEVLRARDEARMERIVDYSGPPPPLCAPVKRLAWIGEESLGLAMQCGNVIVGGRCRG
jgi:hypothetical protein